ncbi:MAG: Jag N-terminal domain-containing protein, partial [Actinomycetota bacterium]
MEWVETTGRTIEEAKNAALEMLGVDVDDAEFEIIEEPKPGLFGRTRGEARVRARVRPTQVRPKTERRDRRRREGGRGEGGRENGRSDGNRNGGEKHNGSRGQGGGERKPRPEREARPPREPREERPK